MNIGQTMAAIARMTGASVNLKVLANLKGPSEILSNLRAGFSTVLKQNDMKVTTFWEGKGLSGIPGFKGKVFYVRTTTVSENRTLITSRWLTLSHANSMTRVLSKGIILMLTIWIWLSFLGATILSMRK